MSLPFRMSKRALRTPEPPISWLMKYALDCPQCISLAAGFVDTDTLPVEIVGACTDDLMASADTGRAALQYGTTIGLPALRRQIVDRLAADDGITFEANRVDADCAIVTSGSQQLLFLISDVLLDEGDIVILGGPSYFVYMGILHSMGAIARTVPMDADGMDVDALERVLADLERAGQLDRVKLVYDVSFFQNPMGVSLSTERRKRMLQIVQRFSKRHRIFILEDAAYKELRFADPSLPPTKKFDTTNEWVLYTGTFCKPFSAGMKTGFGVLPKEILEPVLRQKGNHDFGSANLNQMIISRAVARGDYDRHVQKVRAGYRKKAAVMADGIRKYFPAATTWYEPQGGLYIWAELPASIPTGPDSEFFKAALAQNVLYVPGDFCFYPNSGYEGTRSAMRLSYGVAAPGQVAEGIKRLGELACEMLSSGVAAK
ncbi:MAG: PLP-dependent aminotransferase family protein [Phycisphaerae bacterium]|nr:PLP-dependent aminotransferase family protein [Phycisphaerae bacterium]